jgi:ribosomal protein S18 acetylase RimI-like enzyme
MKSPITIRLATRADIAAIKSIVDVTVFPADMLDDMIAPFFDDPASRDVWFVAEAEHRILGVTFCEPERMTEGSWNMLAIGVSPDSQGQGVGAALTYALEDYLASQNGRILIVETSGLPEFEQTRTFYHKQGYRQEARIQDFYADGDDKIVFWKSLKV